MVNQQNTWLYGENLINKCFSKKAIITSIIVAAVLLNCVVLYALSTPIEFLIHDINYTEGKLIKHSAKSMSYELPDKTYLKNKFFTDDGYWYLANDDAFIVTGFVKYNDNFYYFLTNDEGYGTLAVQKTFKTKNGYYSTTKSGRVLKNNIKVEEREKYYDFKLKKTINKNITSLFNFEITEPGIYRSVDDEVYGFIKAYGKNGEEIIPATGLYIFNGYYYVFDENGKAKTGVVKYGNSLHYCLPSGERKGIVAIGEFVEDGRTYTTDNDGYIVSIR